MLLRLRGIQKAYRRAERTVLDGVDLDLEGGTLLAITGSSGAGKSTLLQIVGGLLRPGAGTVEILGQSPWTRGAARAAAFRRRHLGFLAQHPDLLPELDVVQNAALPRLLDGDPQAEALARHRLASFGVEALAARRPAQLSGGERQRVALARALLGDAALVLADEPTAHLDPDLAAVVLDALRGAAAGSRSVVVATHDPLLVAAADRVVHLEDGRLRDGRHR
ncbi:MAG: ABC transporter ATP-binding protein [Planctomycetota bacterium]